MPQLYSKHHANVKYLAHNDAEFLIQVRKRNASTRFDYYDLAHNNSHKLKQLITFTYSDPDARFKMQVINEMRNYFNKLVRNLQTDSIKHFSNIEIGENFDNPHLHIQIWHDEADSYDLKLIYDKVIQRYGLMANRCSLVSNYDDTDVFHYVVKDYRSNMSDDYLLKLHMNKVKYRKELGFNLRFSSHSKSKYTKVVYKRGFGFGILKNDVDFLLDHKIVDENFNVIDDEMALFMVVMAFSSLLGQIYNKWMAHEYQSVFRSVFISMMFEWWVYGFVDRLFEFPHPTILKKGLEMFILLIFQKFTWSIVIQCVLNARPPPYSVMFIG